MLVLANAAAPAKVTNKKVTITRLTTDLILCHSFWFFGSAPFKKLHGAEIKAPPHALVHSTYIGRLESQNLTQPHCLQTTQGFPHGSLKKKAIYECCYQLGHHRFDVGGIHIFYVLSTIRERGG